MKKGFTLIELLAVIVILAVIALIATPIVLSIINDTKVSALLRSAEFYVSAVENSIMRENMNSGGNFNPKECVISSTGVICDTTKTLEVEINGESPSSGSITFQDGKITGASLTFGDRTIIMNSEGKYEYQDSVEVLPELITFTITGREYQAETGMTWEEWFDSEYNIEKAFGKSCDDVVVEGTYVEDGCGDYGSYVGRYLKNVEDDSYLSAFYEIVPNHAYQYHH